MRPEEIKKWRDIYVAGKMSLQELSERKNAPSLSTLKRLSRANGWEAERKVFRAISDPKTDTKQPGLTSTETATKKTQKLLDATEILARHVTLSKTLQNIIFKRFKNITEAEINKIPFHQLAPAMKIATDIERQALGMSTNKVDVGVSLETFATLSDADLRGLLSAEADPS